MPKKLVHDINRGYLELNANKIEDILTKNISNTDQVEPAEQEIANAQQTA